MFEIFEPKNRSLAGKKGLVLGIANRDSIAYLLPHSNIFG